MTDVLIVQQFEILIINIFGMHIGFIILQVLTIMEVPLAGSQIGPCLKCWFYIRVSSISLATLFKNSFIMHSISTTALLKQ
jgi:hypothetical protein